MVPYVRMSFWKHWKDGLKYINKGAYTKTGPTHPIGPNASIDTNDYKVVPEVYKYAMDMTVRETYQAVEGMFHNLNSLQSRSGNQLK
jgi:ribonucleoside-triphosphate reductase